MILAAYKWFTRKFLTCREAARLVSESCERELTFGEKMKLKLLCIMCPYTARYDQQVGLMHDKLRACSSEISDHVVGANMPNECKDRLKSKLRAVD